jgi:hypothetical protein
MSVLNWKMSATELQKQVASYDTLKITESSRGKAALLVLFSAALTGLVAWFHLISIDAAFGIVIYVPLAWFIYRGHRWAMGAMMLLWTLEKGAQILGGRSPVSIIIWWLLFVGSFYQAYQVEQARRATRSAAPVPSR